MTVVAGDFLGNGKPDLAFVGGAGTDASGYGVSLVVGNGDGTFTSSPLQGPHQVGLYGVQRGDFNGDGKQDLAVTNWDDNTVTIMLGNGDGTFSQAGSPIPVGPAPIALGVGDFNHDGNLDLAVLNSDVKKSGSPNGSVTILLGNGDGTFTQAPGSPIAKPSLYDSPTNIAIGDFDGDGTLDLAIADGGPGSIWILLGNGDGTFRNTAVDPISTQMFYNGGIAAGDFNGDGKLDLVVTGVGSAYAGDLHAMNVLLGNGDGSFTAVKDCCGFGDGNSTRNFYMTVADFNGDGRPDVAILSEEQSISQPADFVQILLNQGDGTFTPTDYSVLLNPFPTALTSGDFDSSGRQGIAALVGPEALSSLVQVPNPSWSTPPNFTVSAQNTSLAVKAGGSITDNIAISSQYGFYGEITGETCTGLPTGATCTFNPAVPPAVIPQMMLPLENFQYTITITTTAPSYATSSTSSSGQSGPYGKLPLPVFAAMIGVPFCFLKRSPYSKLLPLRALALVLLISAGISSCGNGTMAPNFPTGGTPPGTYSVMVSATSPSGGGLRHSAKITLTVQ